LKVGGWRLNRGIFTIPLFHLPHSTFQLFFLAILTASFARADFATVIYDSRNPSNAVSTPGKLVVEGDWNLADKGEIFVELSEPVVFPEGADKYSLGDDYSLTLENPNAVLPDPRDWHSEGVYAVRVRATPGRSAFTVPIPPAMETFVGVVKKLDRVSVNGLFDRIWPNALWNFKEAGWGNGISSYTLDASKVVRLTVTGPGGKPLPIKSIAACGTAHTVKELPDFAKIPSDKFFPFIDKYGQFKWYDWPGKVRSDADLKAALEQEEKDLAAHPGPADFDKWGGWKNGPKFAATGHFYVKKVEGKWWFVDPDGYLWWSHGPVRVSASCGMTDYKGREHYFDELPAADSPLAAFYKTRDELLWPYYVKFGFTNTYDFTAANLYRKYGPDWPAKWCDRVHRRLRSWGANTIANSSDARVMQLSRTPYCDRFELKSRPIEGTAKVVSWWPFRDPFDPSFREEVKRQMALHKKTMDDPWCFGFFVDNELPWGWAPDLGRRTWDSPDDQPAKIRFKEMLKAKYGKVPEQPTTEDFEACSAEVADAYFRIVREEFKRAAPNKLYMGCRFSGGVPLYMYVAAKYVDVMSFNYYRRDVAEFDTMPLDIDKPVVIGEFHVGAHDRGPFRSGLVTAKDQADRAAIYRRYLTSALKDPRFVGAHWHQFSDDVSTGRFDGENFQIGWVDICDNPYPEMIEAVRWVGDNMYRLRWGY